MDWEPVHTGNFWFTHHASKDKGFKALCHKGTAIFHLSGKRLRFYHDFYCISEA
jgi:hypothetical protein